ncbi:hypothetical protein SAMD00019534_087650 [Acytostelium subglobosum LB1]|uniref:hypothetical protein n=1 Tax=Acytostelium subglobosum LB1 TaxID=1410327 RepID=UPI000644D3AD|nr:hypothetical protein SAMD00019534_087650 [Acytostelium subglobosum LB1]GAM25590.1 hypothetical protein SAMD00019534_087650 [Acytostelium subglobosum LB1]|eukprot:XP_012751576.1 hypothetical protein SAMD00019534_087650 [Acytostelium subglobosum LB1]
MSNQTPIKIMDFQLKGEFVRKASSFRNFIKTGTQYPPEPNRYHLYVSLACPWAHRTIIVRRLKGLRQVIGMTVVDYFLGADGWHFSERDGCEIDPINKFTHLSQLYKLSDPLYEGRYTVPVLWDKKTSTIVNNDSGEIIRMLNAEFNQWATNPSLDLTPRDLLSSIDETNSYVYDNINNGVYKCGFAGDQQSYDSAFKNVFTALDHLEARLSKARWLVGDRLTEADIRLFTTLIRFDAVYYGHFKVNKRMIKDYPALSNYLRSLYQNEAIKPTVNFHHIKHCYYESQRSINPSGIVPIGPELSYLN